MKNRKLLIFSPNSNAVSETFIRSHIEELPFDVYPRFGTKWNLLDIKGKKIFPIMFWLGRVLERVKPTIDKFFFNAMLSTHLKKSTPDYILAEYGTTAAWLVGACQAARIPLYVIFHGYDAYQYDVLKENNAKYKEVFQYASGIIAVSKSMKAKLISLGASPDKVRWSPCGVDPDSFRLSEPDKSPPVFFAVGRFVEKKAPYLTILAFKSVFEKYPEAKLRMAGDGPLLGPCKRLIQALGLDDAVTLLGSCSSEVVANEMRNARAFVQHSVVAENGDSEGTPVAVIEAQMSGLPVISTNHAGIPDVVIDKETGFIVQEGDCENMAKWMLEVLNNPQLAKELGQRGRSRAVANFSNIKHIGEIANMILKEDTHVANH